MISMIKLLGSQADQMVSQPETGMGYQTVRIEKKSGELAEGTVYNCELLDMEHERRIALTKAGYQTLLASATTTEALNIKSIQFVPRARSLTASRALGKSRTTADGPATEARPQNTDKNMIFARFSAYRDDKRVTREGSLVAGTYATTWVDARLYVKTGEEAVERYALPNPTPAKFCFRIAPLAGTSYRQGIVQPAHGHAGRGVEVIFDYGTNAGSVTGPTELKEC